MTNYGEASASSFLHLGGDYTAPFICFMMLVSIKEGGLWLTGRR